MLLGTINSYTAGQGVTLTIDGEDAPTTKNYYILKSYTPVVGDRVLIEEISGSYVVLGCATGTSGGGSSSVLWGNITGTLSAQTDLQNALNAKQAKLTAGDNISISSNNTISASFTETDPIFTASPAAGITAADITEWDGKQDQLTAGTNITIDANNVISASSGGGGAWGSITGTLSDQTDLQTALDAKLSKPSTAGTSGMVLQKNGSGADAYAWSTIEASEVKYTDINSHQKTADNEFDALLIGITVTISASGWSASPNASGYYVYTLGLTSLNRTMSAQNPVIALMPTGSATYPTDAEASAYDKWQYAFANPTNNNIVFYAKEKPTADFTVLVTGVN